MTRNTSGGKTRNTSTSLRCSMDVGERNWVSTQIRNGLMAGEFVVTTPEAEGLRDGIRIIVEKEKNPR